MTVLALLRHGDTAWSREKRIQGSTDVPLDGAGRRTLARCAIPPAYRGLRALSSPLRRCVETARLLGLHPIGLEPRIAEMRWGQWEGRCLPELRAELGAAMAVNEDAGWDFRPTDGESPREVLQRVQPWLEEIGTADDPALTICHRGVIRVVFAAACGWDMRGKPPARLDWRALQVFEIDTSGRPKVLSLNVPLDPAESAA